jgi:hypothetical protein
LDYNISVAKCEQNLNTMIDRIREANPNAEIILMTMNPAFDTSDGQYFNGTYRPNLPDFYQGYRDVAAARGLQLIDVYNDWTNLLATNSALFAADFPDGLHPTAPASLAVTLPAVERGLQTVAIPSYPLLGAMGADGFTISTAHGVVGATFLLQAATNITLPESWKTIATNTPTTNGWMQFYDPAAAGGSGFYRTMVH